MSFWHDGTIELPGWHEGEIPEFYVEPGAVRLSRVKPACSDREAISCGRPVLGHFRSSRVRSPRLIGLSAFYVSISNI